MKYKAIIVDLDGTIAINKRKIDYPTSNTREEWDKFHKAHNFYKPSEFIPIKEVVDLIENYIINVQKKDKVKVIFLSAREDTANGLIFLNCYRFIKKHFKCFSKPSSFNRDYTIIMRNQNDYRPNDVVKRDILEEYVLPNYKPIMAFEDEEDNTKMFTEHGITVLRIYNKEV